MTYASQADLEERFGLRELVQLTDRTGSGVVDTTVVARALADADAEIDAYLGARYELPLASTPSVIVRIACDLARHRLWGDRASLEVLARRQDAIELLDRIARGVAALPIDPPPAETTSAGRPIYSAPDRIWTASLEGP